jgi:hypothetical protein
MNANNRDISFWKYMWYEKMFVRVPEIRSKQYCMPCFRDTLGLNKKEMTRLVEKRRTLNGPVHVYMNPYMECVVLYDDSNTVKFKRITAKEVSDWLLDYESKAVQSSYEDGNILVELGEYLADIELSQKTAIMTLLATRTRDPYLMRVARMSLEEIEDLQHKFDTVPKTETVDYILAGVRKTFEAIGFTLTQSFLTVVYMASVFGVISAYGIKKFDDEIQEKLGSGITYHTKQEGIDINFNPIHDLARHITSTPLYVWHVIKRIEQTAENSILQILKTIPT